MEINKKSIVGEIVRANYKAAPIFEEYGVDFCCGGNISVDEACEMKGLDSEGLIKKLESAVGSDDPDSNYINNLPLDKLCDYIEQRHHSYVVEITPFLQQKLQKLCDVHGANHSELFAVKDLFDGAVENLTAHMGKEEGILFPYVRRMETFKKEGGENPEGFGNILDPVNVMMAEHDTEGERFRKLRMITGGYQAPADGCSTYEVTYRTLEEFENDLHRHIHIENNILFPKAIEFEAEILSLKAD